LSRHNGQFTLFVVFFGQGKQGQGKQGQGKQGQGKQGQVKQE
jgi:hypothetical protein